MKHKEKEHLKEDPFVRIVEKIIDFLRRFRREILLSLAFLLLAVLIIIGILFINSAGVSKENRLLADAQRIKNEAGISLDEKITRLNRIEAKRGISSVTHLYIAVLYFQKGDFQKAGDALDKSPDSKLRIINDEKALLQAEILNARGNYKEALDRLNILAGDSKTELSKDYILFKTAQIQFLNDRKEEALQNFRKLSNEFPSSQFQSEAREYISRIQGPEGEQE